MGGKLSTGIGAVDRRLDGGLDAGDLLSIVSPPATQSQTLLYQLMNQRPTLYVTTLRPETSVERDIAKRNGTEYPYRIEAIGDGVSMDTELMQELTGSRTYRANSALKDDPLDEIYELIESIDGTSNVIIDPMNPFERGDSREAYAEVLSKLGVKMQETGGLGVFHCHTTDTPPSFRDSTLTIADVVWKVDVTSTASDELEHKLVIPKNRGGDVVSEELSLELGGRTVHVDDSRTI